MAGYDRTHVFTFDYIYGLPALGSKLGDHAITRAVFNDWQISGVTRFWSGLPLTVGSNGNAGTLGGGPRANYLGGTIILEDYNNRQWFDPLVFERQTANSATQDAILFADPASRTSTSRCSKTSGSQRRSGCNTAPSSSTSSTTCNGSASIQVFRRPTPTAW